MFRIFSHIADAVSSGYYRSMLPANKCGKHFIDNGIPISLFTSQGIPDEPFDAYVFHRIFPPEKVHKVLCLFKDADHRMTWEIDDDLYSIPDARPSKQFFNKDNLTWLSLFLSESKKVIVSTEHLKQETLYRVPSIKEENVVVLANLLSSAYYNVYNEPKTRTNKLIRILWTGSDTHVDDLDLILPAVRRFRDNLDVQFIFHGFIPSSLLVPEHKNIVYVPWSFLPSYTSTLSFINPDISLVPCIDDLFNRSKSNIKILETVLSGAICVTSKTGEYGKFTNDYHSWMKERPGAYSLKDPNFGMSSCEDDPDDWIEKIEFAIENAREIVPAYNQHLKQFVTEQYTWDYPDNPRIKEWIDFYTGLTELQ